MGCPIKFSSNELTLSIRLERKGQNLKNLRGLKAFISEVNTIPRSSFWKLMVSHVSVYYGSLLHDVFEIFMAPPGTIHCVFLNCNQLQAVCEDRKLKSSPSLRFDSMVSDRVISWLPKLETKFSGTWPRFETLVATYVTWPEHVSLFLYFYEWFYFTNTVGKFTIEFYWWCLYI